MADAVVRAEQGVPLMNLMQIADALGRDDPGFVHELEMCAMAPQEVLQQVITGMLGA